MAINPQNMAINPQRFGVALDQPSRVYTGPPARLIDGYDLSAIRETVYSVNKDALKSNSQKYEMYASIALTVSLIALAIIAAVVTHGAAIGIAVAAGVLATFTMGKAYVNYKVTQNDQKQDKVVKDAIDHNLSKFLAGKPLVAPNILPGNPPRPPYYDDDRGVNMMPMMPRQQPQMMPRQQPQMMPGSQQMYMQPQNAPNAPNAPFLPENW